MMETTMQMTAADPGMGFEGPSPRRGSGLFARLGVALLRRAREAAWTVLDLHTEFEALD